MNSLFDEKDFNRLNNRISELVEDGLVSDPKHGLIQIFLSHRLYCEQFEIDEAFTDGGNDCGIDAVHVDNRSDCPVVHLFQSKVHESVRKASNPFKYAAAEKVLRYFNILSDPNADLQSLLNPRLYQKTREIQDIQKTEFPEFKLWIVSNGSQCVEEEIAPFVTALRRQDVEVEEFHLNEFVEYCLNSHSRKSSHTFYARETGVLEFGNSELRSHVGYISAQELYGLVKDLRNERKVDYALFDMNVRGFLGINNSVNQEIFKTAASTQNVHFASFNNGITMVGTQVKVMRTGSPLPKIGVKRLSIVNGAQTCSAIFDAMKDFYPNFEKFEDLSVLFRIFQTDNTELITNIAISTNNQNRIHPRDLRANDKYQMQLERNLAKFGIHYVRKRGAYNTGAQSERSLDALKAGQLILSYVHSEPARAKRDSDSIFTEWYQKIFANADAEKLVEAIEWFDLIEQKRDFIQDEIRIRGIGRVENTFVTYGALHILMLCGMIDPTAKGERRDIVIEQAIEIIARKLVQAGEPAYYSYFRDPKQTSLLSQEVDQPRLL